jgi:glyoxylase-like metal-dependent hydrolase (beta-lactamase superfamily II)
LWQFEERLVHPLEAPQLRQPLVRHTLLGESWPTEVHEAMADEGLPVPDVLVDALPHSGFDPAAFSLNPCTPTRLIEEGDGVELGGRILHALHLPGHSPGGVGLFEESTGLLFSGDVVYDGALLDDLPGSSVVDYVATMRRLRDLPVTTVHAGHDASFGRRRLGELADAYVRSHSG